MEIFEVVYSSWYLSDRWGSPEESGCTLHKDMTDFDKYVENYHASFTNELVVCIYFVPRKPQIVRVIKEIYNKIIATSFGLKVDLEEEQILTKENKLIK